MNKLISKQLLVVIALTMGLLGSSFAQTVTNGSVTGAPVGNSQLGNAAGWSGCGFSPDLCDAGFPAYSGGSSVAASPSPDGGSWVGLASLAECGQTTITGLTVGNSYNLCFYGACFGTGTSIFDGGPAQPTITVGGTSQSFVIPKAANTWTLYTMPFTATAATMTLQCVAPNVTASVWGAPGAFYVGLDGFSISIPGATATWTDPSPLCDTDPPINLDTYVTGTPGGVWSGTGVTGNSFDPASGTQSVTYTVNPGGCDEVSQTISITVNVCAVPCDPAWTTTSACSTDPPINLDALITGDPGGVWTGTGVTGNMFDPSSGTQSITYTNATPCTNFSTQTITVTTTAVATWNPPVGLCTGDAPIDLNTLVTGTAGGIWTGTGVTGNMFDPAVGTQSITYAVGTSPCDDVLAQNITVGVQADASWTLPIGLCLSSPLIDLNTLITGTAGGNWSGTGVTGNMFDPAVGSQTLTYDVGTAPCDATLAQLVNVTANGDASWTIPLNTCIGDAPFDLNAFVTGTAGGIWTGTGVTGNMFDPSVGTQTITYSAGVVPCDATLAQSIVVTPASNPAWTMPVNVCAADPQIDLNTLITGDVGGTWSGTGVTGNMFDPAVGSQTLTYNVGAAPCDETLAQLVNVTANADASWTIPLNTCIGDAPFDLNAFVTGTAGGIWTGIGVTGNMFDPSVGTQTITYSAGVVPCDATSAQSIVVTAASNPAWTIPVSVCAADPQIDLNTLISGDVGGTWSGTGVTGNMFDPAAGTQNITYTVGNGGCQGISTQSVTVNLAPDPSWTSTTLCTSSAPINLTGQITGLAGGTWSGTGMSGSIFDPFFGTQSITYTVTAVGCTAASTQNITVVDPQVNVTGTNVSCFGLTDGSAVANVTGGSGNYTYSWDTTPAQNTATASTIVAGTYIVTVTDVDGGCNVTGTVTIIEPVEIVLLMNGTDACSPDLGSADVVASGGVGGFTYSWTPVASTAATVAGIDSAMAAVVVTDTNGCSATDSIFVNVWPAPTITVSPDTLIYYGGAAQLIATGGVSYSWNPTDDLDCSDCSNPIAEPLQPTLYCVTVTDANGCQNDACTMVDVEIVCGDVFVPSAFSPNGDGENDVLCVYSDCMSQLTFTIYNRWGEKVYQTSSMNICWDGTWKGKQLNSAVFVYILDGYLINGEVVSQKGNISLVR